MLHFKKKRGVPSIENNYVGNLFKIFFLLKIRWSVTIETSVVVFKLKPQSQKKISDMKVLLTFFE